MNTSLWTFTNPGTPSTLSLVGTGTTDALLSIAVPAGSSHDVWVGGNNAPRIMQPANNIDFEVEVKFQSTMNAASQMQGVIVQQDANNFIRFDFVRGATNTRIFAASFVGGTPTVRNDIVITGGNPLWLRVKRQGNQWTGSHSTNGTTFTAAPSFNHTLTVSSIGPFIGNAGSPPPAFTGLVDYFFNTALPISPEDPTAPAAPTITSQPTNQTVTAGQTATFSVTATGTPPPTYQWQKNNVDITGATATSYTTPTTTLADNGVSFRCRVTNSVGTAVSNSAILTVNPAPNSGNVVSNPGFESGSASWSFFTNGTGTFSAVSPGLVGNQAGKLAFTSGGTNIQLFQAGLVLQPNTQYILSFKAYSNTGHDVSVSVQKHTSPYTSYGLQGRVFDLTTSTADYSVQFTTSGFSGTVNDARLMFWFAPYAANADQYFFDEVVLGIVGTVGGPTITTQPSNQSVFVGQTAAFNVTTAGAAPLSYQWQMNNVDIPGATSASYTTPATIMADSGATFRCLVSNIAGSATSNQATLTVLPPPSTIVSDDFNNSSLNTSLWTFVNPLGDATLTMVGTGTTNAWLSMAIPGGVAHDVWVGGNNGARIMQPANNTDFEVEVKFESGVAAQVQLQGVIVQQDAANFLRFDFYSDGSNTKIFAASFASGTPTVEFDGLVGGNGIAPLWLRVKRQGNQWT
ncbi:MAG: immunoglobulin domain-containing protein, partial [Bacteroidota bacterium]